MSLEHKSSHKQHSYICSNSQQYIVWVKIKLENFLTSFLIINRIKKNCIWTTLRVIFFCTLRFQIFKYCPIITTHKSMEWCINLNYDWFWLTSLLEDLRRVQGICRMCSVPRPSETARRCCLAVERNGTCWDLTPALQVSRRVCVFNFKLLLSLHRNATKFQRLHTEVLQYDNHTYT